MASVCKIDYGRQQGKEQGDPWGVTEEAQEGEKDGLELKRSSQTANQRQGVALQSNPVCIQLLSSWTPILWSDIFLLNPRPAFTHLWTEILPVKQQLLSRVATRLVPCGTTPPQVQSTSTVLSDLPLCLNVGICWAVLEVGLTSSLMVIVTTSLSQGKYWTGENLFYLFLVLLLSWINRNRNPSRS